MSLGMAYWIINRWAESLFWEGLLSFIPFGYIQFFTRKKLCGRPPHLLSATGCTWCTHPCLTLGDLSGVKWRVEKATFLVRVGTSGWHYGTENANLVWKVTETGRLQCMLVSLCHIMAWQSRFKLGSPSGLLDDVQKVSIVCAGQHCVAMAVIPWVRGQRKWKLCTLEHFLNIYCGSAKHFYQAAQP